MVMHGLGDGLVLTLTNDGRWIIHAVNEPADKGLLVRDPLKMAANIRSVVMGQRPPCPPD